MRCATGEGRAKNLAVVERLLAAVTVLVFRRKQREATCLLASMEEKQVTKQLSTSQIIIIHQGVGGCFPNLERII